MIFWWITASYRAFGVLDFAAKLPSVIRATVNVDFTLKSAYAVLMFSLDIFCFRSIKVLFFPTIRSKPYHVGLVDPFGPAAG